MNTVILIPSRMASVRFPGKPLMQIQGKTMIQRVWEQAINSKIGEVVVACSELEVFNLITNLGGRAILTDPKISSGTDRIYSAILKMNNISKFDCIINLQGDMPLIRPEQIRKVIEPLKNNYLIGTLATDLKKEEISNPNITKVVVEWEKNLIGEAKEFFRKKNNLDNSIYHHVGIYSFTEESLYKFVKLPKSKNELSLKLEQCRAMDAGINIGVCFEKDIPPSVDTKEDLINVENIIREKYEKNK